MRNNTKFFTKIDLLDMKQLYTDEKNTHILVQRLVTACIEMVQIIIITIYNVLKFYIVIFFTIYLLLWAACHHPFCRRKQAQRPQAFPPHNNIADKT